MPLGGGGVPVGAVLAEGPPVREAGGGERLGGG